jgi:hypothetical protein
MKIRDIISEVASVGATSAANIATVASPHIAVGPDRFKKSYTGTPGKSGTKAPRLPKVVQPKKKDGTAKGAHALPGVSIFGGPLKRYILIWLVKIVNANVKIALVTIADVMIAEKQKINYEIQRNVR